MATDYLLPLEGVKGESRCHAVHPSLALLVADLRRRGKGYVLTSVAHGAHNAGREGVQGELRRLGVVERHAVGADATAGAALGFIVLEAEGTAAGRARPIPVLMVIAHQFDFSRSSTAEQQQLRAAQRHLDLPASCRIVVGTGAPAAAGVHEKWTELNDMGF